MIHLPKRLLALVAPLAIVGALFAVPAMASAAELTDPAGPVAPGTEIRATSMNATTVTEAGALTCESVNIGGELATNSSGTVTLAILEEGEDVAEGCNRVTPEGSEPATITPVFEHLHLSPETNTASFTFVAHLFGGAVSCHFEGTVPVTYESGTSTIHAEGQIAGTSAAPCPPSGEFSGDFELEDENGAVTVH